MKRSARIKSLFFLLLPATALGGFGWYSQNRSEQQRADLLQQTSGPLRIAITQFGMKDITPREAALGYDTKVTAVVQMQGTIPLPRQREEMIHVLEIKDAEVVAQSGKRWKFFQNQSPDHLRLQPPSYLRSASDYPFQLVFAPVFYKEHIERPTLTFLLKSSAISPRDGNLTLRYRVTGKHEYSVPQNLHLSLPSNAKQYPYSRGFTGVNFFTKLNVPPLVIRKAGVVASPVVVSNHCPLSLISIDLWGRDERPNTVIKVRHDNIISGRPDNLKWNVDDLHFENSKGDKYYPPKDYSIRPSWLPTTTGGAEDGRYTFEFSTPPNLTSPAHSNLWMKCKISVNDSWPIEISIKIRPKD